MQVDITYEQILERMLNRVPNTVDKREGSIIYDALAPAAVEILHMYIELDRLLDDSFADTASREYLIKRCAERGIKPHPSTKAQVKARFNISVPIGTRFTNEGIYYVVIKNEDNLASVLECESYGTLGNKSFGSLIPVDYIKGLTEATVTELLVPGEDEEATEVLRTRYFNSLESQAFGGNVADYKEKVNRIPGVGGVKVFPVWQGGGTVKLVVEDSDFSAPSEQLIDQVQQSVDPVVNGGEGLGVAPIGHVVTVFGVTEEPIHITTQITYESGWQWEDIRTHVNKVIDDYFKELNKEWENTNNIIIRISQIETKLLALEGIVDIASTQINGEEKNYIVGEEKIPVRGDINV